MISEGSVPLLYRSDQRINDDPDGLLKVIKSGRYNGRYYTSSMHDGAIYYPEKDGPGSYHGYLLVVRIADGLTTDGHVTDSALYESLDYVSAAVDSLRNAGAPEEVISQFEQLVGEQDPKPKEIPFEMPDDETIAKQFNITTSDKRLNYFKALYRSQLEPAELDNDFVSHYNSITPRNKFEFLKMIYRYTGPDHLRDHGQVALLDRTLRADEFVDLKPYKIYDGNIVFQDETIPIENAHRYNFSKEWAEKAAQIEKAARLKRAANG